MRVGDSQDFEHSLDSAIFADSVRAVALKATSGFRSRENVGDVARDVDAGNAVTRALPGRRRSRAPS